MNEQHIAVILLAGGKGTRMKSQIPKQFLLLNDKPIIFYSFELFMQCPEVAEIVVVCEAAYHPLFKQLNPKVTLSFALPGLRRQDSIFNGLQAIKTSAEYVCTHDGVRPFINKDLVTRLLQATKQEGAATAACQVKFTVKESNQAQFVNRTLDRTHIWEIQTPQMIQKDLFLKGFDHVNKHQLEVTDDVSVVETISHSVKLVNGIEGNIKITTPEDLAIAHHLLTIFQK